VKPFHVYLLRCRDGTFYAGHTDELEARLFVRDYPALQALTEES